MPVLGVLTCEILELEIAHLLNNDEKISNLVIVQNNAGQGLIKTLEEKAPGSFTVVTSLEGFIPCRDNNSLEVLVHVLELGLHSRKQELEQAIVRESRTLGQYAGALFLGYGLCGNALGDPKTLLSHLKIPFFLPQDKDHPADDCVGLFVGGRDCYYQEQLKEAGTFFMTPGWANHWQDMFGENFKNMDLKMARRLFKHYKRTLLVSTPVMDMDQTKKSVSEFNRLFNCYSDILPGSMDMLERAWQNAEKHLLYHTGQTRN